MKITTTNGNQQFQWTETNKHCYNCGKQEVWEDDTDDFYLENDFMCLSCGAVFTLQTEKVFGDNRIGERNSEIEQIIKGIDDNV